MATYFSSSNDPLLSSDEADVRGPVISVSRTRAWADLVTTVTTCMITMCHNSAQLSLLWCDHMKPAENQYQQQTVVLLVPQPSLNLKPHSTQTTTTLQVHSLDNLTDKNNLNWIYWVFQIIRFACINCINHIYFSPYRSAVFEIWSCHKNSV